MHLKVEKFILFLVVVVDLSGTVSSFDSKCPPLKLVSGRTRYRWRGRSVRFNCMRGFHLVGVKYATCMNGKWDADVPICVKYGCRAPSTTHVNGQFIESYRGAVVKIVCNPGYSLVGSPSVYCNGIRWNETFPVCRVKNSSPSLSCGFEDADLCGWSQDPMHDFEWKRRNGSISSGDVGTGRTTHNRGHYMYIENSSIKMENDTASLYSPVYPPGYSNETCFKFRYHMYRTTAALEMIRSSNEEDSRNKYVMRLREIRKCDLSSSSQGCIHTQACSSSQDLLLRCGFLKVYVKPEGTELYDLIPSFWVNGDQGKSWIQSFFLLEPMESPFQIVIEGFRGPDAVGDTAVDDVNLISADDCRILQEAFSSTESSSSANPDDDGIDFFSCKYRCNQEKPSNTGTGVDEDKCSCYETCDRDGTCCSDYFDFCSTFPATPSASTQTDFKISTATLSSPATAPPARQKDELPPSKLSPKPSPVFRFNNESNEIHPKEPLAQIPLQSTPNRTLNEIPKRQYPVTFYNGSDATGIPQPEAKIPTVSNRTDVKVAISISVTKSVPRKIPKTVEKKLLKPGTNKMEIQKDLVNAPSGIPQREVQPKGDGNERSEGKAEVLETSSMTSSLSVTTEKVFKNSKPNNVKLTFLEKPSSPNLSNEYRFDKRKWKEVSGKEPPQAIKIDESDESSRRNIESIVEIGGMSVVILIVIVFGIIWYRRNQNRKSERENMVEDSDIIVYKLNPPPLEIESHSLVCIRAGGLQQPLQHS